MQQTWRIVFSVQSCHEAESETRPSWPSSFNLYVMLRNFVCKIGEDADILMNIFDAKEGKFIRYGHDFWCFCLYAHFVTWN